ncbi:nucleotidyl transferase AbiEii/AbiGii toxin family protein [Halococcus sp. PRR34]|uniref:nucleotidyl transferase AbiEii/AbiGii toxin family protein n=1 Tax=Halococcus sp. PRR34 TaxID=3020830 RepID=UPI0023624774|nr:nucleotidyl transferase AbiEii/AbiGii toxin family protein [Halococcus sp. PRR34]
MTDGFREAHDRDYIGSRDIDIGIHVDQQWTEETITDSPVAETLDRIETQLGYSRGRFGFYQQFHRDTGERLDDARARKLASHNVFRVDIDVLPDTTELDAFEDAFGFRPPAEPLLEPVFTDGIGEPLDEHVEWAVPEEVQIAPAATLAAMKVRAFPDRDKSHKRLKDLADLHALLWYVTEYNDLKTAVQDQITTDDGAAFESTVGTDLYDRTARLIDVDPTIVQQSIERLFV